MSLFLLSDSFPLYSFLVVVFVVLFVVVVVVVVEVVEGLKSLLTILLAGIVDVLVSKNPRSNLIRGILDKLKPALLTLFSSSLSSLKV